MQSMPFVMQTRPCMMQSSRSVECDCQHAVSVTAHSHSNNFELAKGKQDSLYRLKQISRPTLEHESSNLYTSSGGGGWKLQAKAWDSLAMFYEACAQIEIDEFRDYQKALQVKLWVGFVGVLLVLVVFLGDSLFEGLGKQMQ